MGPLTHRYILLVLCAGKPNLLVWEQIGKNYYLFLRLSNGQSEMPRNEKFKNFLRIFYTLYSYSSQVPGVNFGNIEIILEWTLRSESKTA